ncbi:hypothetical protein C8J55DRAFT_139397 [Lentinula edodes]|uniref:Uncharacterized protein n=1 Tax=Lentinula lateritia TaxID=40482 RepID=A0A9W9A5T1_9AGAR|nr:hypothetical protein C8J55DRAFT_139397 [Lentinula edodes]
MPGNICSNCKAFNSECTHTSSSKKKTTFVNITAAPPELTQLNQPNIPNAQCWQGRATGIKVADQPVVMGKVAKI